MSYAKAAQKNISPIRPPAKQASRTTYRQDALAINIPSAVSLEDIFKSFAATFPESVSKVQIQSDEEKRIIIQALDTIDTAPLISKGLLVGKITCQIYELYSTKADSDVAELVLNNVCFRKGYESQIKDMMHEFCEIIDIVPEEKYGIKTGKASVLVKLNDQTKLPPSKLRQETDMGTVTVYCNILRKPHCVYCRSVDHVRKDCQVAPACRNCGDTGHGTDRCTSSKRKRQDGPPLNASIHSAYLSACFDAAKEVLGEVELTDNDLKEPELISAADRMAETFEKPKELFFLNRDSLMTVYKGQYNDYNKSVLTISDILQARGGKQYLDKLGQHAKSRFVSRLQMFGEDPDLNETITPTEAPARGADAEGSSNAAAQMEDVRQ